MKKLALILLLASTSASATGFLTGSYVSGMNRVCLYNQLGSTVAITIKSFELCPLSI